MSAARDYHHGVQLAPGIYTLDDTLHIDEAQFIFACGGDPNSPRDRMMARRAIARICADEGIPYGETATREQGGAGAADKGERERRSGMAEVCLSCKAPIVWVTTERGKRMPVDAEPIEGGTILLSHRAVSRPPVALVQSAREIELLTIQHEHSPQEGPLRLFVSHFSTCPHAGEHRRR